MKIVLTVHQFFPDFFSGTETLTYETARELKKRGHVVNIVTGFPSKVSLQDHERFDRYLYDGITVERFYHAYVPMGEQTNIQELEYYNKFFGSFFENYLYREKPDIVHFFHLSRLSAVAVDVCSKLGIKTVFTPTDFWFICPTIQLRLPDNQPCPGPDKSGINCLRHVVYLTQGKKINSIMQKMPDWLLGLAISMAKHSGTVSVGGQYSQMVGALAKRSFFLLERLNRIDHIAIPTQVMMRLLLSRGLKPERMTIVPFGINLSYLNRLSKSATTASLRLGYIGTLSEAKGLHVLLKAIKLIPENKIELKIYGRQSDFPEYTKGLKDISQDDKRVKFCDTFPGSEIGTIFAALDILVVPSLWYENSPLVVYYAQAAGCPVIASDVEGISTIIDNGKNGLLFKSGNVSDLVTVLRTVLKNRELVEQMSNKAKVPPTIQDYVDQILSIYQDLSLVK